MAIALTDLFKLLTDAVNKGLTAEQILSTVATKSVEKGLLNQQEVETMMGGYKSADIPRCQLCNNSAVRENYTNCRNCKKQHHLQCGFPDGFCSKRCRTMAERAELFRTQSQAHQSRSAQ